VFISALVAGILAVTAAVEVAVSLNKNLKSGVAAAVVSAGHDFLIDVIEYESLAARAKPVTVTVPAVVESEAAPSRDPVPFPTVIVNWLPATPWNAACEGAELSKPIPNAATDTSAMRLKFVVVDIYFLSSVVTRNFLVAASR